MGDVPINIDDSEEDSEGVMVESSAGDDGGMGELKRQHKAKRAERVKAESLFRRLKEEEENLAALIDTMERHEQDKGALHSFPCLASAGSTIRAAPLSHKAARLQPEEQTLTLCGPLAEHARNRPDWAGDPYFTTSVPESSSNSSATFPASIVPTATGTDPGFLISANKAGSASTGKFKWSEKVEELLRDTFRLNEFRPLQRNVRLPAISLTAQIRYPSPNPQKFTVRPPRADNQRDAERPRQSRADAHGWREELGAPPSTLHPAP
jgi:hypothetical protein